jgi:hypothetical protein
VFIQTWQSIIKRAFKQRQSGYSGCHAGGFNGGGESGFTWTDNGDGINELSSDTAYVAVYNEQLKRWVQNQNIATRNAGTCSLDVPAFSGKPVQTYIGFMSADRKKVSRSLFAGLVNVI